MNTTIKPYQSPQINLVSNNRFFTETNINMTIIHRATHIYIYIYILCTTLSDRLFFICSGEVTCIKLQNVENTTFYSLRYHKM